MTKKQFLNELSSKLSKYSYEEIQNATIFYDEIIDERMEEGMDEEQAVLSLGDIKKIVLQIKVNLLTEKLKDKKTVKKTSNNMWQAIILLFASPALIPLGLGAIILGIAIIVTVTAGIFATGAVSIAALVSTIPLTITTVIENGFKAGFLTFGLGLLATGFAGIVCIGLYNASSVVYNFITKILTEKIKDKNARRGLDYEG